MSPAASIKNGCSRHGSGDRVVMPPRYGTPGVRATSETPRRPPPSSTAQLITDQHVGIRNRLCLLDLRMIIRHPHHHPMSAVQGLLSTARRSSRSLLLAAGFLNPERD